MAFPYSLEHEMQEEFTFSPKPRLALLIEVFNQQFLNTYNTCLEGGAMEPLYQPAEENRSNRVIFTRDYFSSALHEAAHWCIAGEARRQKVDYGYWYAPDGRTAEQQRVFESVEVKPQAIERIFSYACGQKFSISADNLDADIGASQAFIHAVHEQTIQYCEQGLPTRAQIFTHALAKAFNYSDPMNREHYQQEQLV